MATIRIRCLGGSCDAPSYRAPTYLACSKHRRVRSSTRSAKKSSLRVPWLAARYKVIGTDTKATSEGSEGLVVPAWDQEEMMIVALKRQDRKSDEAVGELMFFNASPRHPHVVSIIDAFVDEEHLVIVFEYMAASLMHM